MQVPLKRRAHSGEQRPPGTGRVTQRVWAARAYASLGMVGVCQAENRRSERPARLSLRTGTWPRSGGPWRGFNGARGCRAPHLSGTRIARYLSTATAKRLKMELCVSTSTKQARKRQL